MIGIMVWVLLLLPFASRAATLFPQLVATTIEIGAERATPRDQDRVAWRAPELGHLPPPRISPARRAGLITLRAYLFLAAALVIVKVVQLAVS